MVLRKNNFSPILKDLLETHERADSCLHLIESLNQQYKQDLLDRNLARTLKVNNFETSKGESDRERSAAEVFKAAGGKLIV